MPLPPPASPENSPIPPKPCPPLPAGDLHDILNQTEGLWKEVRGETIFITGGTGFFGAWLLESFAYANDHLQLGARAVVLTRNPEAFAAKAPHLTARDDVEFLRGDLLDFTFPSGRHCFVIHAANDSDPQLAARDPAAALAMILRGTDRLLDFAAQAGTQKLLLTSSGAVYGKQPPEIARLPEDFQGEPAALSSATVYAAGKRALEEKCAAHARRFGYEVKIARCFAFVGPHLPLGGNFAAGNFIRNILRRESIQIDGDGTPYRSYLYAADLAIWLWTILFRGQPARAYNVGSANELTIAELAALIGGAGEPKQAVVVALRPVPGTTPARYVPAIDRARHELRLAERVSLPTAIQRTIQWYRPIFK